MGQQELEISEPIVPLLETIVPDAQSSYAKILANHFTVTSIHAINLQNVILQQSFFRNAI
jgi:hypothetical protein